MLTTVVTLLVGGAVGSVITGLCLVSAAAQAAEDRVQREERAAAAARQHAAEEQDARAQVEEELANLKGWVAALTPDGGPSERCEDCMGFDCPDCSRSRVTERMIFQLHMHKRGDFPILAPLPNRFIADLTHCIGELQRLQAQERRRWREENEN